MNLVMLVFFMMMCRPWTYRGTDDDRIDLGSHRVLEIRGNQQERPRWIRLRILLIQLVPKAYAQSALKYRNARILRMPMMLPVPCGDEERIGERLSRGISVTLEQ